MKILDAEQIRYCDKYTIENEPIASIDLMERAAQAIAQWILNKYQNSNLSFTIFAGSGNNGGDALVVARLLAPHFNSPITVFLLHIGSKLTSDCETNLNRLSSINNINLYHLYPNDPLPPIDKQAVVLDGIFGSGLNRQVEGFWATLINHINSQATHTIAIDIPSGLFCTDNTQNNGAKIKANTTLTLQLPKLAFLFAENEPFVGSWHILPIGLSHNAINNCDTAYFFTQKDDIAKVIKPRSCFAHKGNFGHAFLVAGSYQMCGAAILSAQSCLHTGCGLLTVHVPEFAYTAMQTAVPEAILNIDTTEQEYCQPETINKYTAIGIGPGIGQSAQMQKALNILLQNSHAPMVIDADAINILANNKQMLTLLQPNTILTPHPGEFDRLTHKHNCCFDRLKTQQQFAIKHNVIIVLKGAYTSIAMPNGKVFFNSTGNPGMATAGSGDVLTGIILSLLSQKYSPSDAAMLGVYLHGLAGNIAAKNNSQEWIIASSITQNIGKAFIELKNNENE